MEGKYTKEFNEIINEYDNLHSDYDQIIKRIDELKEKLSDLDLLRQESEVKLMLNREREKKFINNLIETDFEAYLDLKKNIKDYISKKILNEHADYVQHEE